MEANHKIVNPNDKVTNQLKSIFDKINTISTCLQNLEKQNELLMAKVDNIEKHINISIQHNSSANSEKNESEQQQNSGKENIIKDDLPKKYQKKKFSEEKIIQISNDKTFKIGYMGEGYIYEYLQSFKCFSKIKWNAKTDDVNTPYIILNNGNKYHIDEDGGPYDLLATDKGGKTYYFEVKSTNSDLRSDRITDNENHFNLELSHHTRQYILAKVCNVFSSPKISFKMYDPKKNMLLPVDVEKQHTNDYFIKSLYNKKDNNEPHKNELHKEEPHVEELRNQIKENENKNNRINIQKKCNNYIIVGGNDEFNQLGEKQNNKNKYKYPIISPPVKLSINTSSIFSYSSYNNHTVLVMNDGSLKGIGNNKHGQISAILPKTVIKDFTDFLIKDESGQNLSAISAVCSFYSTLYLFSKSNDSERQLVLCDEEINDGTPVFLDIGNHHPLSLFGGWMYFAVICNDGEIIFINRYSIKNSPNSKIEAAFLPDNELASSVACCDNTVFVLSASGMVFSSPITNKTKLLKFSQVSELSNQNIICISGTFNHCLAVSLNGRVFGYGSNEYGQLGLGEKTNSTSLFKKISSLSRYGIISAYAGYNHSLFKTHEGKILSCGYNSCGELLLDSGPSEIVYSPTETMIISGATFCIGGYGLSVVFIGNNPPSSPNA